MPRRDRNRARPRRATPPRPSDFRRDEGGTVVIYNALLMTAMLGMGFAAIKVTDYAGRRSDVTAALDAAGLAVRREASARGLDPCSIEDGTANPDEVRALNDFGVEYFAESSRRWEDLYWTTDTGEPFDPGDHLEFSYTCDDVTVTAAAQFDPGYALANLIGAGRLSLEADATITFPVPPTLEVAMVLDITGSMSNSEMDALSDAVDGFLEAINGDPITPGTTFDNAEVAVVPFTANVAHDPAVLGLAGAEAFVDLAAEAHYHGARYFHVEKALGLPDVTDRRVNHLDLWRSTPYDWSGCLEARPHPLDELAVPAGSANPNAVADARAMPIITPEPGESPSDWSQTKARITAAFAELSDPPADVTSTVLGKTSTSLFVPAFYWDEHDSTGHQVPIANNKPEGLYDHLHPATDNADTRAAWPNGMYNRMNGKYGAYDGPGNVLAEMIPDREWASYRDVPWNTNYGSYDWTVQYRDVVLHWKNNVQANTAQDCREMTLRPGQGGSVYARHDYPMIADPEMWTAAQRLGATDCQGKEFVLRQGYVGYWDEGTETYKGRYDVIDQDKFSFLEKLCPTDPLMPLTDDAWAVSQFVAGLEDNGRTNVTPGVIWAWHTLRPEAPYTQASEPERGLTKVALLMTDGQPGTHAAQRIYGYTWPLLWGTMEEDRLNIFRNWVERASPYQTPEWLMWFRLYSEDQRHRREQVNKVIRTCMRMRDEGIRIFAVGFKIDAGSRAEQMLKGCAVEDYAYVRVQDNAALRPTFERFVAELGNLRVSD